jgi:hypothetical protein
MDTKFISEHSDKFSVCAPIDDIGESGLIGTSVSLPHPSVNTIRFSKTPPRLHLFTLSRSTSNTQQLRA